MDDDAEQAWSIEIRRRLSQLDSGVVAMLPWPQALQALRSIPES